MIKRSFPIFLLTGLLCASLQKAACQDTLLTVNYNGTLDSLQSTALKQKRMFQVFVPPAYKPGSAEKYDVLYVLDGGNWNISLVTQLQRFIQNEGHMPPSIIVSIMGIDRNVELTPTVLKSWNAPTGGAARFLAYIKNELVPYINQHYPSNGDNTLWGHSLGGMFATYVMLQEPGLFKSYIAADPSLWWDDCLVPKMAVEKLQALHDSVTYFVSGRTGTNFHEMKIDSIEAVLKAHAPANLKWKIQYYDGETHSSLRLKTIYDGLMYTYEGMTNAMDFYPANGIVLKDKPYQIIYSEDTTRIHYTLDGSMPTAQSPQAPKIITVTGPATLTYARLGNRSRYNSSIGGKFTIEMLPPPLQKPGAKKPGGFAYTYYEGEGAQRPNLASAAALKTGIMDKDFNASMLPRKNSYCLVLEGLLEVKEDGYYCFFARAGKGSTIRVAGRQIMHWSDDDKRDVFSYQLPLSKGFYPVRIESYDKKEDFNLLFYYLTPSMSLSGDPMPVPMEVEYGVSRSR